MSGRRLLRLLLLAGIGGLALGGARAEAAAAGGAGVATFAGGCFWCMEEAFEAVPGVNAVIDGYTGGTKVDPTYQQVSSGGTGHAEAIEVHFDPAKVSYEKLLDVFWHNVDPLAEGHQFCDYGDEYRSEIFYHDGQQKEQAEASKAAIEKSGRFKQPIVTKIVAAGPFYEAEDYHQDYYRKNPIRYKFYHNGCGRADRLEELWGPAS